MAESNGIDPMVSVLMTAYNREKYIAEAIESVLASSYINFELIIVDDCSIDNTVEIAKSYEAKDNRIKVYINEVNLGDYPNRNKAASYVRAGFMTYVDSDDLIFPNCLQKMVEALSNYPNCGLIMLTRDNDEPINAPIYLTPCEAMKMHFENNGFLETGPLGTLINKVYFNRIGGFSNMRMIGDVDFFLRMASKYPIVKIQKNLVFWRKHESQETSVGEKFYLVDIINVYKQILFNPNFPAQKKRVRYFIKIIIPRCVAILKLAVKKRSLKKIRYLIDIFKIIANNVK